MTWLNEEKYTVQDCIEFARSCIRNRDSRDCTIVWLDRAIALADDLDNRLLGAEERIEERGEQ